MSSLFFDIECYHGYAYFGFKREEDGKRVGVEYSSRCPDFDRDFIRRILLRNTTIGFNSLGYDIPMTWFALQEGTTNEMLKRASDGIIKGRIKWWEVERFLGIQIPWDVKERHIDLIEPQPNAVASLKTLNGRMHGLRLQDLPFPEDLVLSHEQMDIVNDYCLQNDLDATHSLWDTLKEPMALRVALGAIHGQDFRSKSDSQIGEAIVKKRVEQITGRRPEKNPTKPGTSYRYPIPEWVQFKTPHLQTLLDTLRTTDFIVGAEGKTETPAWMNTPLARFKLGSETYQFGIGGIHTTEENRARHSDDTHVLLDGDVASQYPAAILMLGLYPPALGPEFLTVYNSIRADRLKAKKRAKEIKDELKEPGADTARLEKELAECQVADKGGKIFLNGVYGKLGSRYSILYAPHLLLSVTITCQLAILMLVERALAAGIGVISANTDGVLFRCPRQLQAGLNKDRLHPSRLTEVCDEWERDTGFDLEFGEYRSIYNQSVNAYFAIKASGGHKRKGPLGNPWNQHPDDLDPVRGQLMKNPQMTICSDAALALIKDGTPIEKTILACRDIRQFVTVIKAAKGATWRGRYLGKVVRYYWGIGGEAIQAAEANEGTGNFNKVPKSDGAIECMTLPDAFPTDIDVDRYVAETNEILKELGYFGDILPPEKSIRITKANRRAVLGAWVVAA